MPLSAFNGVAALAQFGALACGYWTEWITEGRDDDRRATVGAALPAGSYTSSL